MVLDRYSRFKETELVIRDELAIDRTLLANERTLLAYLRSGVALLIAGVSIIHFAQEDWFFIVGIVCLPAGLITVILGLLRYQKMNKAISCVRKGLETKSEENKVDVEQTTTSNS